MDANDINIITKLLQSGGNVAAMVAIYLGFKVLEVVKKFFDDVQKTMVDTVVTNKRVIELLEEQARAPHNRRLQDRNQR